MWAEKIRVNYSQCTASEDELSEMKILYEILAWFVTNYGEENYSLILEGLLDSEKEIFKKYLLENKNDVEKNTVKNIENIVDEPQVKEDIVRLLLEKGENYYFGRGVKKIVKKPINIF